jgi:hypothetical protein
MKNIPAKIRRVTELNDDVWIVNIHASTTEELLAVGFSVDDFNYEEDPTEEQEWISSFIEVAKESGLDLEVIQFSLKAMKENPDLTPAMAMRIGFDEWVK